METMTELFTRKDYLQLPEGFPAELIEGVLVKDPSPTYGHQDFVLVIVDALRTVVPRGLIRVGPVDAPINDINVYVPDVAVFRTPPPDDEGGTLVPRVVFEILSPRTARRDREVKRVRYLEAGVEEVWLVDRAAKTVELYRGQTVTKAAGDVAARSVAIPGFEIVPSAFFEEGS